MIYYGFTAYWNGDTRQLEIKDPSETYHPFKYFDNPDLTQRDISDLIASRPDGYENAPAPEHILYTDIITSVNGKLFESYNINGRTCIVVEDLMKLGYDVQWNNDERTLTVQDLLGNLPLKTDIGTFYVDGRSVCDKYSLGYYSIYELTAGDASVSSGMFNSMWYTLAVFQLKELCEMTGIQYSYSDGVLSLDTTGAQQFTEKDTGLTEDCDGINVFPLHLDKLLVNGVETKITYKRWVGHMMEAHEEEFEMPLYYFRGKVYINGSFIHSLLD